MTSRKIFIGVAAVLLGGCAWVYLALTADSRRISAAERAIAAVAELDAAGTQRREAFSTTFAWSQLERNRSEMIAAARELVDDSQALEAAGRHAVENIDAVLKHAENENGRRYWTLLRDSLAKRAEAAAEYAQGYAVATSVSISERQSLAERATPFIERAEAAGNAAGRLQAEAQAFRAKHREQFSDRSQ